MKDLNAYKHGRNASIDNAYGVENKSTLMD